MVDLPLPVGPVTRKMPCGQAGEVLHAGQHVVVETQAAEVVEIAGGAIQQAHDDAFAVERGQGGNAQIDFAADDFDLDAAILRQAPLGDIQLGHQLEAADDGGLEFARRRFLVEEHAIHAEAHAEFLLERLDVNIAGALLDGLGDHGVDQADDGSLARHVAQVFEIGAGLLVVALGVGALFGFAVIPVDGVEDFLLGGERGADLQAAEGAHGGDGLEIQRIGHRDGEDVVRQRDGNGAALAEEAMRQAFDFGSGGRRAIHGDQGDVELIAERGEHVAVGDGAHVHQDLAELIAALQLEFEGALDILGLDLAAFQQDLAEPQVARAEGGRGCGIGRGIGMRGQGGGHYRSSVSTLPAAAEARSARMTTCAGMPVVSSQGP